MPTNISQSVGSGPVVKPSETKVSVSKTETTESNDRPTDIPKESNLDADVLSTQVQDEANTSSREAVEQAVSKLNDHIQTVKRELQFEVEEDTGRTIITVIDQETNEVIREIPPEQVRDLADSIDKMNGDKSFNGLILQTRA